LIFVADLRVGKKSLASCGFSGFKAINGAF